MEKKQRSKRKKDIMLPLVILIGIVLIAAVVTPIAKPILQKTRFEKFQEDFTESLNYSKDNGNIIIEKDGRVHSLDPDTASWLYYMLANIGMGTPVSASEEPECEIRMTFPDGAEMKLGEMEVKQGPRAGRMGIFVYFKNAAGKEYRYYSDVTTLKKFREAL
ncbi:MAG: hypothetical protein IKG59_03115 [Firmicutes bacterium]|nr:hypothetical protein [Bacillota bacterium]